MKVKSNKEGFCGIEGPVGEKHKEEQHEKDIKQEDKREIAKKQPNTDKRGYKYGK